MKCKVIILNGADVEVYNEVIEGKTENDILSKVLSNEIVCLYDKITIEPWEEE